MKILIEDVDEKIYGVKAGWYEMAIDGISVQSGGHTNSLDLNKARMASVPMTAAASSQLPSVPMPAGVGDKYYRFAMSEVHDAGACLHHIEARIETYTVNSGNELEQMNHGYLSQKMATDKDVLAAANPVDLLRSMMEHACIEVVQALAKHRMSSMFKKSAPKTGGIVSPPSATKKGALESLIDATKNVNKAMTAAMKALNKPKCKECGDSGEWTNPAGGRDAKQPCSRGCKKP